MLKIYKVIKVILVSTPIILLVWLIYKDILPSGQLEIVYDFCHDSPFFSQVTPKGRVLGIVKTQSYCFQEMVIDPVYFDVRLPQSFRKAKVNLWYQKDENLPLKIGPALSINEWKWDLKKLPITNDQLLNNKKWRRGEVEFDLSKVEMRNQRLRFMISSPGLDRSAKEIKFKRIEVFFEKEPFSWDNLFPRIKNLIKQMI